MGKYGCLEQEWKSPAVHHSAGRMGKDLFTLNEIENDSDFAFRLELNALFILRYCKDQKEIFGFAFIFTQCEGILRWLIISSALNKNNCFSWALLKTKYRWKYRTGPKLKQTPTHEFTNFHGFFFGRCQRSRRRSLMWRRRPSRTTPWRPGARSTQRQRASRARGKLAYIFYLPNHLSGVYTERSECKFKGPFIPNQREKDKRNNVKDQRKDSLLLSFCVNGP